MANQAFEMGFSQGSNSAARRQNNAQDALNQQRQAKAALIEQAHSTGRLSDTDAAKAIHALYGPDEQPSALRHIANFARKVTGRKAAAPPPKGESADQILSGAKSPEQMQQDDFDRKQSQSATAQENQKRLYDKMMGQAETPEQKAFVNSLFKVKPEAETSDTRKRADFAAFQQAHPDYKGSFEQWGTEQAAAGREKPVRGWTRRGGKVISVLIDPTTNQPIAGSEDGSVLPPAYLTDKISTGFYHWVDADNKLHATPETRTSGPSGSGSISTPAPRANANSGPPKAGGDKVLGTKGSAESHAAKKDADAAESAYLDVQKAGGGNGSTLTPVSSQGIVLAWLRGRVNRVTSQEIASVKNLGGIFDKFDGNVSSLEKGTMTPQQYSWFLKSAKDNFDNKKQVASKYSQPAPKGEESGTDVDAIVNALKGKKKP